MTPDTVINLDDSGPIEDPSSISWHSGFPNPGEQAKGLSLDFNRLLIHHPQSTFVFRLRGHNWQNFGIWDRDLIVADRGNQPSPKDLVIWCRAGETGFSLSHFRSLSQAATVWGKVTAIVHQV